MQVFIEALFDYMIQFLSESMKYCHGREHCYYHAWGIAMANALLLPCLKHYHCHGGEHGRAHSICHAWSIPFTMPESFNLRCTNHSIAMPESIAESMAERIRFAMPEAFHLLCTNHSIYYARIIPFAMSEALSLPWQRAWPWP